MKRTPLPKDVWLICIVFLLSRIILSFFNISMDYGALSRNWQYLDLDSLQHDLLRGVWFDHTQPPVFNLFLGIVLKLAGAYAATVFPIIFLLIGLANILLLYAILKKTLRHPRLPLIIALFYGLSPASMLFEKELFYTSFISLLLLTSCFFLLRFRQGLSWKNVAGFGIPLIAVCLTRSMYHLVLLLFISLSIMLYYRKAAGFRVLLTFSLLSWLLVGGWYLKNYILFKSFSTSTWMGMNIARNVFHDAAAADSTHIEFIEPFSAISAYRQFLPANYAQGYAGLDDRVLLQETKNDSFINEKHIGYLEISKQYMAASKREIATHPTAYLKNVAQSCIIFFAPATRYPFLEPQARKIRYYDLLYSFNLSHFATGKQQRRIALTLSAIPKLLIYLLVFAWITLQVVRTRQLPILYLFITSIIGYIFVVSSLFEHYENMRFRYEAEPLFLILAGQVIDGIFNRRQSGKYVAIKN